jgi:hypothetical protein
MPHSQSVSRSSRFIVSVLVLILMMSAAVAYAGSSPDTSVGTPLIDLSDSVLGEISAQGISVGGDLSTTCMTGSNAICLGTLENNDNHQFEASDHKGAIDMSGYVQQNVSAEINVNQTQGSTATGVTLLNTADMSNSAITLTNSNNATNFVGGF